MQRQRITSSCSNKDRSFTLYADDFEIHVSNVNIKDAEQTMKGIELRSNHELCMGHTKFVFAGIVLTLNIYFHCFEVVTILNNHSNRTGGHYCGHRGHYCGHRSVIILNKPRSSTIILYLLDKQNKSSISNE
jgi:hypothetical protein